MNETLEAASSLLLKEPKKKRRRRLKDTPRIMMCLGWPRLRRPNFLGARPMIAGCLLLITASVIITLHAGICVGGMWRCNSEVPEPRGPEAIVQLRRDVAATLIRVAADVRSGNTAWAAAELEATAALLDNRYFSKVKSPSLLKESGGYIPPPLRTSTPTASSLQDPAAGQHEESRKGILLERVSQRDLLVSRKTNEYKVALDQRALPKSQNLSIYGENDLQVSAEKPEELPVSKKNTEKGNVSASSPLKESPPRGEDGADLVNQILENESLSHRTDENSDLANSVKSVYQMFLLPGEGELDDLRDKTLLTLNSQVTVLIDGCRFSPAYTVSVVRQAGSLWPGIAIVVGVDEEKRAEVDDISHRSGVTLVTITCEKWRRIDLTSMLEYVHTPFSLLLDGISAVTDDVNLVRLLSILVGLRSLGVGIVGAAERGRDGFWDYTCTRLTLSNARLTMREGYEFSRAACLFCDVTSSSFLAATYILREVPFDMNLPYRSQMIDWGLQLQRKGILTMTCPDVMFHTQRSIRPREQHRESDNNCITKEEKKQARAMIFAMKRQYRKLAQKWEVNYVTFNNGTSFEYNCREIRYDCNAYHKVKHYVLPPCCLKIKYKMFNIVDIIAKENRVPYEINSGTLLGAVKFKDGLPWDFDDDAYYRNSDVEIFIRNKFRMERLGVQPYFSDQVNKVNHSVINKYIYSASQGGFFMDLWGINKMPSEGTIEALSKYPDNLACLQHGYMPTPIKVAKNLHLNKTKNNKTGKPVLPTCFLSSTLRVGSNWLTGPWNPGKKALSHYGDNLYHHQGHWRWSNVEHPGWKACPRPGHHLCLDIHPMDGSLPFL